MPTHHGVPTVVDKLQEILDMLRANKKIRAVQEIRLLTGAGLMEAKMFVDEVMAESSVCSGEMTRLSHSEYDLRVEIDRLKAEIWKQQQRLQALIVKQNWTTGQLNRMSDQLSLPTCYELYQKLFKLGGGALLPVGQSPKIPLDVAERVMDGREDDLPF